MSTIIVCASGPSLTVTDCSTALASGHPVIAVNSTWEAIPQCNHIYAGDLRWWDLYAATIPDGPELWTCNTRAATRYGLNLFDTDTRLPFNSGQRAILFAASLGARNIILLGYDCSIEHGSHWHGDHHELDNPNSGNIKRWHGEFMAVAEQFQNRVNIINSSRETSLSCFRRMPLQEALKEAKR